MSVGWSSLQVSSVRKLWPSERPAYTRHDRRVGLVSPVTSSTSAGPDDRQERDELRARPDVGADRGGVASDRRADQRGPAGGDDAAALALGVVVGDRRVDQHEVAARPDAAADVGDGEVPRERRVDDEHVGLAGDRAAAVVGAVALQGRAEDRDVAVEGEDRAARTVRVAAVDERVDRP